MVVYRCEDSLESIFTAIYQAYEEKREHGETQLQLSREPLLFAEEVTVIPDNEKVVKVMRTLRRRFGEEDYMRLCMALAAQAEEKAQAVYRTVVDGLRRGCSSGHLFDNLSDHWVHTAFSLARAVEREIQHLKGFVRFEELENGILYARIGPKSNALTFLMPHFADRLPIENFVLYDAKRNFFGLHPAGKDWYLFQGEETGESASFLRSENEEAYRELFCGFCRTIEIKERRNLQLQQNLLPLRFREYMVEL